MSFGHSGPASAGERKHSQLKSNDTGPEKAAYPADSALKDRRRILAGIAGIPRIEAEY
jgi:hypothetical protein